MRYLIRCLQIASLFFGLLLSGCDTSHITPAAWTTGKLVVIVPETVQGAEAEFERELAHLLTDALHTQLELMPMQQESIQASLQAHQAHLAAASLRNESNSNLIHFGPVYQIVREQIVCNASKPLPKSWADLTISNLAALAGSSQEVALKEAQKNSPTLQWQTRHKLTAEALLTEVSEGKLDCAAVNERQLADASNYHTNLTAVFDIAPPSKLAWGFPSDADPELLKQVDKFFARIRKDGTLNRLLDRYYGHNNRLTKIDAAAFITAANNVLPHYREMFEEAASISGEDWHLLAALAYQESQWDPFATSFTNVRGMMMLTEETADRMQLSNRLDARENIIAGAKYLSVIKESIPDRIQEPDRTWLALAAYNQGLGHLEDARVLTSRAKQNPDSWADVKKWMAQLNQPEVYDTVKHGYARGGEAVILVENIRNYHDMLKRIEPEETTISYKLIKPLRGLLH
ncbi:MAG: membrane-bound lytic murein transglycosylase MltF [Gallionella sp.]|nr:membrane-bound lytic murein transglycosylase MltF [Gallionella sp.]